MLDALEGIHRAGFLHRDVKPANFALARGAPGPATPGAWRALDFGLARRYVGDAGEVLPAREGGEFRGSSTYASVQAHAKQDLGALGPKPMCSVSSARLWPAYVLCTIDSPRVALQQGMQCAQHEKPIVSCGSGHTCRSTC